MNSSWRDKAFRFAQQLYRDITGCCTQGLRSHVEAAFSIRTLFDDPEADTFWAEYYLVNHQTKTLFWLHDLDAITSNIASELYGNSQAWHFGLPFPRVAWVCELTISTRQ
jgi:hypothetical protein